MKKLLLIVSAVAVIVPAVSFASNGNVGNVWNAWKNDVDAFTAFFALPFNAGIYNPGKVLSVSSCNPAANGKAVVNVVMQVKNDADSGFAGYWALDHYAKMVRIFPTATSGTYCVVATYNGGFTTVAGNSPNDSTVEIPAGINGRMSGGYVGMITGATLIPHPAKKTFGSLGTLDYGCAIDASGNVGSSCTRPDWIGWYFSPEGSFSYVWWGWKYSTVRNGSWINAQAGSSGNIVPATSTKFFPW